MSFFLKYSKISFFVFFILQIIVACKEEDKFDFNQHNKAALTTFSAESITKNEALFVGKVNTINGAKLSEIGFLYSATSNPSNGGGDVVYLRDNLDTGRFVLPVDKLQPGTVYYYCAYARNSHGTAYGELLTLRTESAYVAKLETREATNVTRTTADVGGSVTDSGGHPISRQGICFSMRTNMPSVNDAFVEVDSNNKESVFTLKIPKLAAGTRYYARAYAITKAGTGYGPIITFTTAAPIVASEISTSVATTITNNSALVGGTINEDNGAPITARGIVYSESSNNPLIGSSSILNIGVGTGAFSSSMTNLKVNTTYYYRVFATNAAGTSYGNVLSFKTLMPSLPSSMTTNQPTNIMMSTATVGGSVSNAGGGIILERGVVYSATSTQPTLENAIIAAMGTGIGSFSNVIAGLKTNTLYYVRSYARNEAGVAYGTVTYFTTRLPSLPGGLTTYNASSITSSSAWLSGAVSNDGGGTINARGIVYSSQTSSPTIDNSMVVNVGTGTGSISATINSLSGNTTYYARTFATNEAGTAYGALISFTTQRGASTPVAVSTYSTTSISGTSAVLNGNVADDGGSTLIEKGFVYSSTTASPTVSSGIKTVVSGSGTGTMSKSITGLSRFTSYYVRAYATNAYGTTYGSISSFYIN